MEMDSLQAPLISNRNPEDHDAGLLEDDAYNSPTNLDAQHGLGEDKASPGLFMWLLTLSAGISGLLFGCMSASISSSSLWEGGRIC